MDVRMPDGTVVTNVPDGTTKAQLMQKLGMADQPPQAPQPAQPSGLTSFGHHALGAVAPTAGGLMAGALAGSALGGAAGSVFPGVGNFVGAVAGGIGGGLLGGAGVQKAQDYLLDKMPAAQKFLGQDTQTRQAEESAHPYASLAGSFLPQAAAFRVGGLGALGRTFNAGLTGATEAGQDYEREGKVDPLKVGIAAGAGALMGQARGPLGKILNPIHQTFNGVEAPPAPQQFDSALNDALQQQAGLQSAPQPTPADQPVLPGLGALEPAPAAEDNQTAIARVNQQPKVADFHPAIQSRLDAIAKSSPVGKSFVEDLAPKIADGSITPEQSYFAIAHIGDAIQRVLGGTDADIAAKVLPDLLTPSGERAQGRYDPTKALLEFSLHPDALQFASETGGHEAFHFLQQTFAKVDPKGSAALGKVFTSDTTPDSLPEGLKTTLKGTAYPIQTGDQPVTYWDKMVEGQGGGDKPFGSRDEAEAHVFGAIDSMRNHGVDFTVTGPGQRFSKFVGDVKTRIANGLTGAGFQTAEDVLHAYSGGKAAETLGEGMVPPLGGGMYSARQTDGEAKVLDDMHNSGMSWRQIAFDPTVTPRMAEMAKQRMTDEWAMMQRQHRQSQKPGGGVQYSARKTYSPETEALMKEQDEILTKAEKMANSGLLGISPTHTIAKVESLAKQAEELGAKIEAAKAAEDQEKYVPRGSGQREANLKNWFGDAHRSMKTADGTPKTFYHLTRNDFEAFDPDKSGFGTHFGTYDHANGRTFHDAASYEATRGWEKPITPADDGWNSLRGDVNLPVHLNLKNPVRTIDHGSWSPQDVANSLSDDGHLSPDTAKAIEDLRAKWYDDVDSGGPHFDFQAQAYKLIRDDLKKRGYDGVVYLNRHEGLRRGRKGMIGRDVTDNAVRHIAPEARDSYITFDPSQSKSVFNRGGFDPEDPRYMYSKRLTKGDNPDFYSPTAKMVKALPGGDDLVMSGEKWKNVLASTLGRYKSVDWKGEHEYLQLNDWLSGKPEVTKGQLLQYIDAKMPDVVAQEPSQDYRNMNMAGGNNYRLDANDLENPPGNPSGLRNNQHLRDNTLTWTRSEVVDHATGPKRLMTEGQTDIHQAAAKYRASKLKEEEGYIRGEMEGNKHSHPEIEKAWAAREAARKAYEDTIFGEVNGEANEDEIMGLEASFHNADAGYEDAAQKYGKLTDEERATARKEAARRVPEDAGYIKEDEDTAHLRGMRDALAEADKRYEDTYNKASLNMRLETDPSIRATPFYQIMRWAASPKMSEVLRGERAPETHGEKILSRLKPETQKALLDHSEALQNHDGIEQLRQQLLARQTDYTGKVPAYPLKKSWSLFNFKRLLHIAHEEGQTGVLLPTTAEQVAKAEGWGKITEENGRYYIGDRSVEGRSRDVTPIVKRAIKELPDEADKWLRSVGHPGMEKIKAVTNGKEMRLTLRRSDGAELPDVSFPFNRRGQIEASAYRDTLDDRDEWDIIPQEIGHEKAEEEYWHAKTTDETAGSHSFWSKRKIENDGDNPLPPQVVNLRRQAAAAASGIPGLEDAMNRVYAPISPKKSMLDRTKGMGTAMATGSNWERFYMKTVDEAYPLSKLDKAWADKHKGDLKSGVDFLNRSTGKDLRFQLSSYKMRSMVNRSAAHAGTDMFVAPFALTESGDFTTSKTGKDGQIVKPKVAEGPNKGREVPGLMEIWAPAYKAGVGEAFHFYMDANRGIRLAGEGREKNFSLKDKMLASQLEQKFDGKNGMPDFKDMADMTHEFNKMKLDGMVKAGVITRAAADVYLDKKDYTPFYREWEKEGVAGPVYVDGVNTGESVLHRKLKGSEAKLADPLERWYRHLQALDHAMLSNESAARAMDQALDVGVARKAEAGDDTNVITVRRNGEKVKYVVDDPLLHESLAATDGKPVSAMMQIFRIPTNILRQFTTHVPTFILMHAMRESMTGFVTGDGKPLIPIIDAVRGIKNSIMNTASAKALSAHGITGNFDYRPGAGQGLADTIRNRAARDQGLKITHANGMAELAHNLWGSYETMLKAADAGVRTRVYENEMAIHGNPAEAAYQAGAKAVNFQRRGSSPFMSYAFSAIPFLNARIQGTDLILRTMVNQGKNKGLGGVLFSRGMALAATTAAYYLAVKDNDTYKKAASIYKDGYWIVPTDMFGGKKGEAVIMPIPFEAGVLYKNIPEHIMRSFFGDDSSEDMARATEKALVDTLQFNPLPQLIRPAVEVATNHSFFTGRQIVPESMQMPGARKFEVEPNTSTVAKMLGEATGGSPIDIDYLIRGYLGTVGEWGMEASDVAGRMVGDTPPLPNNIFDNASLPNTPLVKRFLRESRNMGDEETSRLYDLHGETQGLVRALNRMQGAGDAEGMQQLIKDNKGDFGVKDAVNQVFGQVSQINKTERQIQSLPEKTMSGAQKADALQQLEDRKYALSETIERLRGAKKEIEARP